MIWQDDNNLKFEYELAMGADEGWQFFSYLYNFVKKLDTSEKYDPVLESFKKNKMKDNLKIDKLAIKARKEIELTHDDLGKYVLETKNSTPGVLAKLADYDKYLNNEVASTRGQLSDLYECTWYPMMLLVENGDERDLSFVKKYCLLGGNRTIESWTFSPSFVERRELIKNLEKVEKGRAWFCWDRIYWAYRAIDDCENVEHGKLLKGGRWFDAVSWAGLRNEITDILSNQIDSRNDPVEFKINDYKYYLSTCYSYVCDFFRESSSLNKKATDTRSDVVKKPSWNIEIDQMAVHIFNSCSKVSFSLSKRTGLTLSVINKHPKKNTSWIEICKKWTGDEMFDLKYKEKVYYHAVALNKQIALKTGISDLIVYQDGEVGFNQIYARDPDLTRPDQG